MKHLSPLGFVVVSLLFYFAVPTVRGADAPKPVTILVQFTSTEGKVYSSTASKVTGSEVQVPVSISESQIWIVRFLRDPNGTTLYVSATIPGKTDSTQASEKLLVFQTEAHVENGKPVTVLKTDQYKLEVTLTPE